MTRDELMYLEKNHKSINIESILSNESKGTKGKTMLAPL
jgi:hypothetical protein